MSQSRFVIDVLGKRDRTDFSCGVDPLDQYLKMQASQDVKRRASVCYVALERATDIIAGFYTLSASDLPVTDIDADLVRNLPRYPTVPAARVGRLAIDHQFHGLKLGSALLADAVTRAANSGMGVYAMIVDAKDDQAAAFYRHHGFVSYGSSPFKLIAPMKELLVK